MRSNIYFFSAKKDSMRKKQHKLRYKERPPLSLESLSGVLYQVLPPEKRNLSSDYRKGKRHYFN
jgi:hypothetical protein